LFQNCSPAIDSLTFQKNNLVALKNIHQLILFKDTKVTPSMSQKEKMAIQDENQQQRQRCHSLISLNFEILVESLLQVINRSVENLMAGKTTDANICNLTIEILTYVIKQNHRIHLNQGQRAKNLERFREDILNAALSAYAPIVSPQTQSLTNQVVEDLLE
jgi:hypothetical protein